MTDDRLGTILRDGERIGLHFRRQLRHAPERVWRALTEADDLQHWFPCDIVGERRPGAPLQMPFWPGIIERFGLTDAPSLPGELLVWEPPTVLEYRWDTEVLRWELTPHGAGTELTLQTWLLTADDAPPAESAAAGYHASLDMLAHILDTGTGRATTDEELEILSATYVERLATTNA